MAGAWAAISRWGRWCGSSAVPVTRSRAPAASSASPCPGRWLSGTSRCPPAWVGVFGSGGRKDKTVQQFVLEE